MAERSRRLLTVESREVPIPNLGMCDKAVDENGDRISEVRQPQVCFGEAPLLLRPGPAPPSRRGDRYQVLASIKICQRFTVSSFRMPCSNQGSFFIFSLTSFSSSALKIKGEPLHQPKGRPSK